MNPRAAIKRMGSVLALITNRNLSTTLTGVHQPAPVLVHYPSLANLSAKEMGDWYVHTLLGR